jgi:uncharacterized membrane protein
MYKIEWRKEIPALMLLALVIIGTIIVYQKLPAELPIHWNIMGQVDHYLAKTPLSAFLLPGIMLIMYGLMIGLPYIDPKKDRYTLFANSYLFIRYLLLGFFVILYTIVTAKSIGVPLPIEKVIPAGVSLLLVGIGNSMGKIRQNWFVGFRFPWTMSDEEVWNKTHRYGGKLFVASGFIGLSGILFSGAWTMVFLLCPLITGIIATGVYSYRLYAQKKG